MFHASFRFMSMFMLISCLISLFFPAYTSPCFVMELLCRALLHPFITLGLGLSPSFFRGSVTLLVCVRVGGERIYPCLMSTPFTCHVSTPGYPLLLPFFFSTGFRPYRFCMSVLVLVLRRVNLYDNVFNFSTIYLSSLVGMNVASPLIEGQQT